MTLEHNKQEEEFYYNNTFEAFRQGYYRQMGRKRIACGNTDIYYVKYHYFLPAYMSQVMKFLRRYFGTLGHYEQTPLHSKIRLTSEEFAETAIETFLEVNTYVLSLGLLLVQIEVIGTPKIICKI